MNKILLKALILTSFVFAFKMAVAQETTIVTSDFETWSTIGLKAKLSKQFDISLEQGMRLNVNSTQLDQALTELGFSYKLPYNFKVGMGFRYIYDRNKNDAFDNDFRYNFDGSYSNKINRFNYKLRLRYQNKNELGYTIAEGDEHKPYGRAKLSLGYNIKKWKFDPQFTSEIFRNLSDDEYDKFRLTLGTTYKMKKFGDIKIFYGLERELNTAIPKVSYIAGLQYNYTFKTY